MGFDMHSSIISARNEAQRVAREKAYATPLSEFHPGHPELFRSDTLWPYFERLRNEEPVHFCSTSPVGNYWSVTKYNDIIQVDTNAAMFSSDFSLGGIMLRDVGPDYQWPNFITMDEPRHGPQRKTVAPMFTPAHLDKLAVLIRERSAEVLDNLPRNETFDWVERVSIELTTQMLATLFDFPWEDRRKLTRWSDLTTALPKSAIYESEKQRLTELGECADYFMRLWNERINLEPRSDLISMMVHSDAMRHMDRNNLLGNLLLLIVGGNDTTRNSMTGSVLALNDNPDQYDKLRGNHALIDSFVPEVIRWQTPIAHMRRTALQDTELGGKLIKKGDRVVMWYVSGNRDQEVIEKAEGFVIDRARPRLMCRSASASTAASACGSPSFSSRSFGKKY
jgi:cytochrome P450